MAEAHKHTPQTFIRATKQKPIRRKRCKIKAGKVVVGRNCVAVGRNVIIGKEPWTICKETFLRTNRHATRMSTNPEWKHYPQSPAPILDL